MREFRASLAKGNEMGDFRSTSQSKVVVGRTKPSIDVSEVARVLGAEETTQVPEGRTPLALGHGLSAEVARRLRSTGGRPALSGAERRRINLTDKDWKKIQEIGECKFIIRS